MSAPVICLVDGCEWPIPTARPYPGPSMRDGEDILLRHLWDMSEVNAQNIAIDGHFSAHTTSQYLKTIIRLQGEVDGDE